MNASVRPLSERSEPDSEAEAAWAVEIEKRVAELDAGTAKTIPWEEFRQRVINRPKAR